MDNLKPCPFCGGAATIVHPMAFVECGCTAYGPDANTKAGAIAAWNRRADGWIPVLGWAPGGSLPPDGEKVLICTADDEIAIGFYFSLGRGGWSVNGTVIYWQPLPPPPARQRDTAAD
jgi:Lar family restriction alleviation protein